MKNDKDIFYTSGLNVGYKGPKGRFSKGYEKIEAEDPYVMMEKVVDALCNSIGGDKGATMKAELAVKLVAWAVDPDMSEEHWNDLKNDIIKIAKKKV